MAKQLVGKAPLTLVRTTGGSIEYVYARQPVPAHADEADVRRLLDEDFLAEVDAVEAASPGAVEVPADPGLGNAEQHNAGGDSEDAVQRPPRAAAKEAWVDFAVAQRGDGVDEDTARAQAEALTKQELVERYSA